MDVVVVDIPPKFGILLSRYWESKLKGSLQMDISYSTILVFGVQRRLFRDKRLAHMVTSVERPNNHLINSLDTEMGSVNFFTEGDTYNCSS